MFVHRGQSALGTAKPAVLLSGVATPRTGAMACRPQVDPAILLHRDPRAWEELLGLRCIETIMRKMKLLGVGDLYSLVDFFFEYPQSSPDLLHGVKFEGEHGEEWRAYVERRRLSLGARLKFPRIDVDIRLDGVRIRLSPAALLLPFDRYRERWRRDAYTLYKATGGVVPTRAHPHYYLSQLFPQVLRALAARGYVWVANTWSGCCRNHALAEWLYWLDHARMPHIDLMLGKFVPRSPLDKVIKMPRGPRRSSGNFGALKLPEFQRGRPALVFTFVKGYDSA